MLYTPVPGTPLFAQMQQEGRMLDDVDLADIHGQYKFNYKHAAISHDQSKTFLDWAFRRDFERNGPSLFRICETIFQGWKRYHDDPDLRVRVRFAEEAAKLRTTYDAALWAMEKRLRETNPSVSMRIRELRREIEYAFGALPACCALSSDQFCCGYRSAKTNGWLTVLPTSRKLSWSVATG